MHVLILSLILTILTSPTMAQDAITPTNTLRIGILLFPSFQALDVFGPLDILNMLSLQTPLSLSILAETLDPVSTRPLSAAMNKFSSNFSESVVPTYTLANPPALDVLIVPGGLGTRNPAINSSVEFVRKVYPNVKTLITVCTGAAIAASAGVLDGKSATTNKRAWAFATAKGPKTNWIAKARWVVDGNVWTSAGVTAGIDITLAWVASVWGQEVAEGLATGMEYEWHKDPSWDPFGEVYGLEDVINDPALEKRRRESERKGLWVETCGGKKSCEKRYEKRS